MRGNHLSTSAPPTPLSPPLPPTVLPSHADLPQPPLSALTATRLLRAPKEAQAEVSGFGLAQAPSFFSQPSPTCPFCALLCLSGSWGLAWMNLAMTLLSPGAHWVGLFGKLCPEMQVQEVRLERPVFLPASELRSGRGVPLPLAWDGASSLWGVMPGASTCLMAHCPPLLPSSGLFRMQAEHTFRSLAFLLGVGKLCPAPSLS